MESKSASLVRQPAEHVINHIPPSSYTRRKGGQDRVVIELANYFELAANAIVGPAEVHQFLYDLTYC